MMVASQAELRKVIDGFWSGPVAWDEPLSKWTSLGIGGPAWALLEPRNVGEMQLAVKGCREKMIPWLVIGGGSNLLVADRGFPGLVLVMGRKFGNIREIKSDAGGRILVEAQAGCSLARLLGWSRDKGLSGLEFAIGIPGSVGGAVIMNAGAWGSELKDVLSSLQWLEADRVVSRGREDLDFSYRHWEGPDDALILTASFKLLPAPQEEIDRRCRKWAEARKSKQPKGVSSAGSFFKNPPGGYAGRLIETAGLKGQSVGPARVSEVHANFLVNTGGATAGQMLALMRLVQEKVLEVHGIRLEPEVKIIGE